LVTRVGLPLVSASLICWFLSAVVVQLMKIPDVTCFGSQYGQVEVARLDLPARCGLRGGHRAEACGQDETADSGGPGESDHGTPV
jgi:hypothetical protein